MAALICDPVQANDLIRQRQEMGGDRYDEVWDGLYIMSPIANPEHQWIIGHLVGILLTVVDNAGLGKVYPGANVTDRTENWGQNYRCPDVVVVLKGSETRCRNIGAAFLGGPDFLVEVRSPDDKTFDKLDFYASIGVRELLVVDRDTKAARLFRLESGRLGEIESRGGWLESQTINLSFRGAAQHTLHIKTNAPPHQTWKISPSE